MSTETHLVELTAQHNALEAEIDAELARPMADSLKISDMKRQKLRIKEEIEHLNSDSEQVA
jgi:hypothetical protein